MGRNKTDYQRRHRANGQKGKKSLSTLLSSLVLPRVVGDPTFSGLRYPKSQIRKFAQQNRRKSTRAEARLRAILSSVNGGVLHGRFTTQHVVSGKWIVDFFFPEIRLAIEVDGSIHETPGQAAKDAKKVEDCERLDITLIRIRNRDVFGEREQLLEKLRQGWRKALARKNRTIGKPY